ncbi:hypothetical protein N658DRAFT_462394 [Parathielavia hyrcaniae]|uniref:Uncharacterized protein n=1 Tax=Parathielavia hyrcaniae TaxID=113614 RepID=A0AAN6Q992_9PEZI|nr:hypothetical protein N658DRAFT_462394 [Parathielavia hyrcaniae]
MFHHFSFHHILLLTTILTLALAAPPQPWYEKYHQRRVTVPQSYYEAVSLRRQTPIRPNAVRDVKCLDPSSHFVLHEEYAASLAICGGGLSGSGPAAKKCGRGAAAAAEAEGRSGRARFALRALERDAGAGIDLSREAWTRCVAAARAACPVGSFEAVCVGGATTGDVGFSLTSA